MPTVHLRVNDIATGKPTPVRLRVTAADGTTFAPYGRIVEFATGRNEDVGGHLRVGGERWFYADRSCEIDLPTGVPLRVRASKGFDYRPLDATVTLGPGRMALRFVVDRWNDARSGGWTSGDSRCHFLSPHAALLEAAAEDIDVVHVLAAVQPLPSLDGTAYTTVPNLLAFSGPAPALEAGGRVVAVNTMNVHPSLGRVGLLHAHRPVHPLTAGGDDSDDVGVADWCDQCHRKNGLVVWVDAFRPSAGLPGGEVLAAAVLGKVDAIEFDAQPRTIPLLPWVYRLWDAGVPLALVGGSGKDSNRVPLGGVRTYAHTGGSPSLGAWVDAVRGGRSYVTDGPLLTFEVNGVGPGASVDGGTLTVSAAARSLATFESVEVVANGRVVADARPTAGADGIRAASVCEEFVLPEGGWVAARCRGASGAFAHTSPVWVRPGGAAPPRRPAAVAAVRTLLDGSREWVVEHARFTSDKRRHARLAVFDAARDAINR